MRYTIDIPAPLADDGLKTSQVGFLLIVIYVSTATLGVLWGRASEPALRFVWETLLIHSMAAACLIALALAVPQLRRSLPLLYARPRMPLSSRDALVFLGVMIAWGLGAYRMLVLFPMLRWYPASVVVVADAPGAWSSSTYVLLWALTAGVLAPFSEELIFRGILLNLWRRRWGTARAVLFSAIAFGAIHLHNAIYATIAGIFFALVYLKYRSLWPGTLLHSLYNLVGGPFVLGRITLEKRAASMGSLDAWLPELAFTLAFFPLLYLFWRRFRPAT